MKTSLKSLSLYIHFLAILSNKKRTIILLVCIITFNNCLSQDNFLDATFGDNGKVIYNKLDTTEQATCIAQQSDGKIIAAGTFISRYNLDGSIDTTFGTNGYVTLLPITYVNYDYQTVTNYLPFKITAIGINLNNEIIVATKPDGFLDSNNFYMHKLSVNGQLDSSFNFTDNNYTSLNKSINIIKCLPNGKILCGGGAYHQMGSYSTYFKQFNSDGSVDNTFNTDVYFHTGIVSDIQIQTDGKYVILGNNPIGEYYQSSYCGRINQDGSTDVYFGNLGFININQYLHNTAYNCSIDSDGKIIILQRNYSDIYSPSYYTNISYLLRYNSNGTIDNSFGNNGISIKYQSINGHSNRKVFIDVSQNIYTCFTHNNKIQIDKYDTNGQFLNSYEKGASRVSNDFANVLQTATGEFYFLGTSFSFSDYSLLKTDINFINDISFGINGYVNTGSETTIDNVYGTTHNVFDSKLQSDGKILVCGAIGNNLIKRFNSDGSEDVGFNNVSKYSVESQSFSNASLAIINNKIILGVYNEGNINVFKIQQNGTLDTSFSNNGLLSIFFNSSHISDTNKLEILTNDDNSFYVIFNALEQPYVSWGLNQNLIYIYKFNADGTLSTSFGVNGIATFSQLEFTTAVLQNNNIYIGGSIDNNFAIIKVLPSGSIEDTFGTNGLVTTDFSIRFDKITKLLATSDNKIIALGNSSSYSSFNNGVTAAAKYNLNGSFDTNFGILGRLLITQNALKDAILQPNNEVVFITNSNSANDDFLLTKLTETGQLDIAFGTNGIITTDFGFTPENAKNLLIQPNGQLIAIGNKNTILMARYGENLLSNNSSETAIKNIKVYPNPFIDQINIDFFANTTNDVSFRLFDLSGKEINITTEHHTNHNVILHVSQFLEKGCYILHINTSLGNKTVKIIK